MSHIQRSALVHYSPAEMYQLVNNVVDYPAFLPWCRSSRLISETETEMTASIEIAKGVLNKTFITRNQLQRDKRVDLQLVEGPFKKLSGYWQFDALKTENACKVNLDLEFEFDNAMMSIAAKPIFTQIANSLVDAFCKRAVEVYGERG
jgi:ribosome-associated toxin RatA of RatAB toxin-antitoxin module